MRLLVAEEDRSVCEMLDLFFKKEAFNLTFVHDGETAYQLLLAEPWDFVILDGMLPGRDGVSLCRDIRKKLYVPVIIVSARTNEADRILGLDSGADDYISKPFSPMELLARMRAIMRRYKQVFVAESLPEDAEQSGEEIVHYRDIIIHLAERTVYVDGQMITNLTPKEFDLFVLLVRHPKKVFTREQLLESIWGYDYLGEERTIDVHIKRLRSKVSTPTNRLIVTVWGVGYKLEE